MGPGLGPPQLKLLWDTDVGSLQWTPGMLLACRLACNFGITGRQCRPPACALATSSLLLRPQGGHTCRSQAAFTTYGKAWLLTEVYTMPSPAYLLADGSLTLCVRL